MSSAKDFRTSEEIWLEVQRLVRKTHGRAVVPLPRAICPEDAAHEPANWTLACPAASPDEARDIAAAVEEVQSRWDLRDTGLPVKPTRTAEELHGLLLARLSKLPHTTQREASLQCDDIVASEQLGGGLPNWHVPSLTVCRGGRRDVAAVVWSVRQEFDLAIG